jgi:hypothetical protein
MAEPYAGKGTTALGTVGTILGSIGTAGVLGNGGLLGNIFGGTAPVCSENMPVNRFELSQENRIAGLEADKKLLESTIYTNDKLNDFRNYVDARLAGINTSIANQAVYNATNDANIACLTNKVNGITHTVVPISAVCPEPMKLYNSWTAPTTPTTGA